MLRKRTAMADLTISVNGGQMDRRRRLLAREGHADAFADEAGGADVAPRENAAFPQLSRDRMMRRLISPRLWKHVVVACGLTGIPLTLAAVWMCIDSPVTVADEETARAVALLRGFAGLGLFLSAQLCLLICWVRSASAVDFRGGFRAWRWMAVLLLGASMLMLTGASSAVTDGIAAVLQPLLGTLDAARPALLFVPACACLAFVLRYLVPDMGRCRAAQGLLVCGIALMIGRVLFGMRATSGDAAYGLAISELLIAGLMLSAIQLHCRFVIHVNPNPPVSAIRVLRVVKGEEPTARTMAAERKPAREAVLTVDVVDLVSVSAANKKAKEEAQQPEQWCSSDEEAKPDRQRDDKTDAASSGRDRGKGKPSKKQLRRAG